MKIEMEHIIERLTGNRVSAESTEYDNEVLANLEIVKDIIYPIITDLITNAEKVNRHELSSRKVADKSIKILASIQEDIQDLFERVGE